VPLAQQRFGQRPGCPHRVFEQTLVAQPDVSFAPRVEDDAGIGYLLLLELPGEEPPRVTRGQVPVDAPQRVAGIVLAHAPEVSATAGQPGRERSRRVQGGAGGQGQGAVLARPRLHFQFRKRGQHQLAGEQAKRIGGDHADGLPPVAAARGCEGVAEGPLFARAQHQPTGKYTSVPLEIGPFKWLQPRLHGLDQAQQYGLPTGVPNRDPHLPRNTPSVPFGALHLAGYRTFCR